MKTTLAILNARGDTKLTWDSADPAACESARKTVAELAGLGYLFFLTTGEPADAVTAGAGMLVVRRVTADELAPPEPDPAEPPAAGPEPEPTEVKAPKRRGRPPKACRPDRSVVAVRPVAGG